MRLVYLESPYAGNVELNLRYARAAAKDCLLRGEAPFVSHLLYTQDGILDDTIQLERRHGIEAGFCWAMKAEATVVYADMGISPGMAEGVMRATAAGRPVEYRYIPGWNRQ
jgi:hypothetical protein